MAMVNEANDVLSDTKKREEYDNELNQNQPQKHGQEKSSYQTTVAKQARTTAETQERSAHERNAQFFRMEKAEMLRKKAEERLKKVEEAQKIREEQAQKKTEEAARINKQRRVDFDRQDVINDLSALVMDDTAKRKKNMDIDDERYYATKVLLSMARNDDKHLRRMTEEAERRQRIDDILTLVKEINDKKEWV
jgi:curved DNA-binding protein CbpA